MGNNAGMDLSLKIIGLVFLILGFSIFLLPPVAQAQTGAISGQVTDGGGDIADIEVVVYDSNYNWIGFAYTDTNGDYTVSGLPSDSYKVLFDAYQTGYISEWHDDKTDFDSADLVSVTAPDTTTGIDAVLEVGGSISGRVTDGSAGIADIEVDVYDSNYNWIGSAYTDDSGDYTVTGLPSGSYKVHFYDSYQTGYISEWHDDKTDFDSADLVSVTAPDTTTGIDAVLEVGGSISGRVTDGSAGIADIQVNAYDGDQNQIGFSYTDANGDFTVTGLPSGSYKVHFYDSYQTGYLSEWHNDKTDFDSADPVPVTAPGTTTGIDAVLEVGGSISGQVTDGSTGIADILVSAYDSSSNWMGFASTDANGDYTVAGLPSGNYKIQFYADQTGYISEWHNDKTDFDSADPIPVTAPDNIPGINAVLELGATISGRVTNGSAGISDIQVELYDSDENWLGFASTDTDANGDYTVVGLPSGNYKIRFNDYNTGYINEWHNNKTDFDSADPVPVTAPNNITVDAVLEVGGSISGRITDGNVGIPGMEVSVLDSNYNWLGTDDTDANGEYMVRGLPSGNHKVEIYTWSDTGYIGEWYNNKVDFDSADPVTVTAPDPTTGIDMVLKKFGDELAVDFGINGMWHYDGSWSKLTNWDADDDLAGWHGGLGVDFGTNGLWNTDGSSWSRITTWDAGAAGLAGWSDGLAVDLDANGLWNYSGSWAKLTNWDPDGDMVGCLDGLWVDFGTNGLWNYDGSSWRRITTWDTGAAGLACYEGGLAVDFDAAGLWSFDGSAWRKLTNWDPEDDLTGTPPFGLLVDFGANGLWIYDYNDSSWRRRTTWDPSAMTSFAFNRAVDFDTNGLWKYNGLGWSKITNWDPENMADMDLN